MIALLVFAVVVAAWWLLAALADAYAGGRRPLRRIIQPVRAAVPTVPARIRSDLVRARLARARRARARLQEDS
ncbi:hypothetical protein KVH22_29860 [Streptomyces olivaceus]|uniref:hypothetical protein n=1 Tax=Streptomyces olivaceus TaxID=47716 RepID=UPI001CCE201F|nr:hypothetical protein [Streptomyces olivaceus]MBZ6259725.1 hypothetical protein [Streptomyces olivaceus]